MKITEMSVDKMLEHCLLLAYRKSHQQIGIISTRWDKAKYIHEQAIEMTGALPDWVRPGFTSIKSRNLMQFSNNSQICFFTNSSLIRGRRFNLIAIDDIIEHDTELRFMILPALVQPVIDEPQLIKFK